MVTNKKRGRGPCWVCGHAALQHAHDMGVSTDNEGNTDLGQCRVQLCECKGYDGNDPGNSGDLTTGP